MSLPIITVIGILNRLETSHTTNGKEVTRFQIECSEKNAKGEYDNLYLKGEVWEKASQFLNQYFKNGDVSVVTGKLITNIYEKDGKKIYENKLSFPTVSFPPKAKANQEKGYQKQENKLLTNEIPDLNVDEFEDIIPF